jgi:hypothetical protein
MQTRGVAESNANILTGLDLNRSCAAASGRWAGRERRKVRMTHLSGFAALRLFVLRSDEDTHVQRASLQRKLALTILLIEGPILGARFLLQHSG